MADTLTPKQEAFCLAYMESGNAADAYRKAYDVAEDARDGWVYVEACQLLDNPKIAIRLKEVRDQAAKLSIFNVSRAFEEYEEARQLALKEANPSAAVAAVTGKVKLFGLDAPAKTKVEAFHSGKIEIGADEAFANIVGRMESLAARSAGGNRDAADMAGES